MSFGNLGAAELAFRVRLRQQLIDSFSDEELRTLCFDLGVDYESLPAEGKAGKARELIAHLDRERRLPEFIVLCRRLRPNTTWEDVPVPTPPPPGPGTPAWPRLVAALALVALVIAAAFATRLFRPPSTPGPSGQAEPAAAATSTGPVTAAPAVPAAASAGEPAPLLANAHRSSRVLVAEFDERHATHTVEVARRLEADLRARLRAHELADVSVEVVARPVTSADEALALAQQEQGDAVIWGWYDDLGIRVEILLAGQATGRAEAYGTRELPFVQEEGQPRADISLIVREVLPDNVSFLTLFVIGHLYYLNNQYAAGHAAFDAAMANMPANVELDNEAILHFFQARQLQARPRADVSPTTSFSSCASTPAPSRSRPIWPPRTTTWRWSSRSASSPPPPPPASKMPGSPPTRPP